MPDQTPKMSARTTMTAAEVRRTFIEFFEAKAHEFVPSSPVVPVDDPTLLFTNAGMNQYKPVFLGQADPNSELGRLRRAANSQKCIRAGGKHNDLEDVGKDTYHHTFFEMLGNWSFGDYFKAEAIEWAWELLTGVYGIAPEQLYATYFGGDESAGLEPDDEARELWLRYLPESRVLPGSMKDNFWEMGDTGPCGPCSEIHFDKVGDRDAAGLVNVDPDVIEVWNLVFIQYDRQGDGSLKNLPARHVDTGMGLERLTAILQNTGSNYDTDLFTPIFEAIKRETRAPHEYLGQVGDKDAGSVDYAYRVIADHIRTLTFAVADGAVPSNEGRGYVLRRILRRAVRTGRQFLGAETGFFCKLVPTVVETMGDFFPELKAQADHVIEVIRDEEESFGKTLDKGISRWWNYALNALVYTATQTELGISYAGSRADDEHGVGPEGHPRVTADATTVVNVYSFADARRWEFSLGELDNRLISDMFGTIPHLAGEDAFMLYDTFGFPLDLTMLMAEERGLTVDVEGYEKCMAEQRERSRASAGKGGEGGMGGVGELRLDPEAMARLRHMGAPATDDIDKYHGRDIRAGVRAIWNGLTFDEHVTTTSVGTRRIGLVLDRTNFYAESGGQVYDTGRIVVSRENRASARDAGDRTKAATNPSGGEFKVEAVHAFGEYVLHVGRVTKGEIRMGDDVRLHVDQTRREPIKANHTATHMMNFALRQVLGEHVQQKGSLVAPDRLRFDLSHNMPITPEELAEVDRIVGHMIERDLTVYTEMAPLYLARDIAGLRAVFGEKYPDPVRVVSIGQPVSDLLDHPDTPAWQEVSVEFCGGTHLASTGQARAFAVVHEEGIAKGVRRVVALTGVPAVAAIRAADALARRIVSAESLDGEALVLETAEIAGEIDQLTIPVASKGELRASLAKLQERVKQARKRAAQEKAKEAAGQAKSIAQAALDADEKVIVATIELGSDRGALSAAIDTVTSTCPKAAAMLLSPDEEAGKVSVIASVPEPLIARGLRAGDWVRATCAVMGGKGGGKPGLGQGAASDLSKLRDATKHARSEAYRAIS